MASVGASIGCGWDDDISCICAGESQIALVKADMRRDQAEIASTLQNESLDCVFFNSNGSSDGCQ